MSTTEHTPEQLAAIEARKARILQETKKNINREIDSIKRRIIDVEATAKKLIQNRHVSVAWVNRLPAERFKRMIKVACIAKQMDAISQAGTTISWYNLEYRYD